MRKGPGRRAPSAAVLLVRRVRPRPRTTSAAKRCPRPDAARAPRRRPEGALPAAPSWRCRTPGTTGRPPRCRGHARREDAEGDVDAVRVAAEVEKGCRAVPTASPAGCGRPGVPRRPSGPPTGGGGGADHRAGRSHGPRLRDGTRRAKPAVVTMPPAAKKTLIPVIIMAPLLCRSLMGAGRAHHGGGR